MIAKIYTLMFEARTYLPGALAGIGVRCTGGTITYLAHSFLANNCPAARGCENHGKLTRHRPEVAVTSIFPTVQGAGWLGRVEIT
jgi:hypothetical protein